MPDTDDAQVTYLTAMEISRMLRISKMSVYRLLENGEIPVHRFGRSLRVSRADFDAYVNGARDAKTPIA